MTAQSTLRRPGPATADRTLRRARYRRWVTATTVGELLGFTIPALVGAGVAAAGTRPAAAVGAVLGWAQSWALRRDLPRLPSAASVAATADNRRHPARTILPTLTRASAGESWTGQPAAQHRGRGARTPLQGAR